MPTPTYDLIQEQVLSSSAASVTFSSIPGTYKDLVLELVGTYTSNTTTYVRPNGDTSSLYSVTNLQGDGTTASSTRYDRTALSGAGFWVAPNAFTSGIGTANANIMSYANTNVNKTCISRFGQAGQVTGAAVSLWGSTAAITSLVVRCGSTFDTGFVMRLWGIAG